MSKMQTTATKIAKKKKLRPRIKRWIVMWDYCYYYLEALQGFQKTLQNLHKS